MDVDSKEETTTECTQQNDEGDSGCSNTQKDGKKTEYHHRVWDSQVKELFPELKQQGDVQDLIDRWRKGPAMDVGKELATFRK